MPNYATPGHPYSSQSIYVTVSPVYKKSPRFEDDQPYKPKEAFAKRLPNISRPQSGPIEERQLITTTRSPRAQTAPPSYQYPPKLDYKHRLITSNFLQHTPWYRDMNRWFTPDRSQGVWYDHEDFDRYRKMALATRLPTQNIYHKNSGLMPSYSGFVPGQAFRYGSTWARETKNARMLGIARKWESTSYFQDRPIGA